MMMKFYNREEELKILKKNRDQSKNSGTFTIITGRRRIGKTALILESEKDNKYLYFFVPRGNISIICEQLTDCAHNDLGLRLYNTGSFRDLFEQIMNHGKKSNFTFVIDEFQELERADPSIMSSIQDLWDRNKSESKINLILCGSVYSMMIRIFENYKAPLYGRATSKFNVGPFGPSVLKRILKDHNPDYEPDDLLFLYMVTGGVPKYVELLMDAGAVRFDEMLDFVCSHDSKFITEGKDLLISEFGREYGTYFTILQLIADGKNTIREISEAIGKESGSFLDVLEREYKLVKKNRPLFSKENSRNVRWRISDIYLKFYFKFIYGNQSLIESKRYDKLKEKILSEYAQYSGSVLEDYFTKNVAEEREFTEIGSYWDRKGQNEIDIIYLHGRTKKAAAFEVKRDPKRADKNQLKEKAESVQELGGYDIEYEVLSLKDM
jgi:AAA+ ATPase superfamily predicted ATPase